MGSDERESGGGGWNLHSVPVLVLAIRYSYGPATFFHHLMQLIIAFPPTEIYGICLPSMKSHWRLGCWVGAPASISLQTSAAVFGSRLSFVGMSRGGAMARCGFIGLVSALVEKFEWLSGALYLLPRAVSVPL